MITLCFRFRSRSRPRVIKFVVLMDARVCFPRSEVSFASFRPKYTNKFRPNLLCFRSLNLNFWAVQQGERRAKEFSRFDEREIYGIYQDKRSRRFRVSGAKQHGDSLYPPRITKLNFVYFSKYNIVFWLLTTNLI